ncbi:MAG: carbon-nitrogen family hydrolase [Abitibacteriaceae bacterium]|nr:carbon-nitrogen family hydrolase [Abditibacteriaceae bacterium]MBV9865672.1 carbon-nitrogen family hydrolase [Abditibacteriaceae bacterium]
MKLYGCQLNIEWENKAANHAKVLAMLDAAMPEEGSLVLLPEMFATGFSMNVEGIAEGAEHQTAMFLAAVAAKYNVFIVGGLVTIGTDGKGRNEAAVFNPDGKEIARYCKLHPFSFGGETKHYMSGEDIAIFNWQDFTVAPFICYDLRFPEIFRAAVRRGAQLFTVIANWPQAREAHWITLLQARAIENQAYVAGVNRCGHDPKLAYSGRSLIIDPRGEIIADAGNGENIISTDLDLNALQKYRRDFPALEDMKAETGW